jgi:hypothetical protein
MGSLQWWPVIMDCASPGEEGADTTLVPLGVWGVLEKETGGDWETFLLQLNEEGDTLFEWRWTAPNRNEAKRIAEDCERGGCVPAKAGRDPGCNCGASIAFGGGMGSAHLDWCASMR